MAERLYLGIDVGTGSARAGLFDGRGALRGAASHPIQTWRPADDFVEQSSDDIWRACGVATREALRVAGASPADVVGVGFDATCSLVALDAQDLPVTVSPTGRDEQNVIVWMDHRSHVQTARINALGHEVLRYVGGVISPEMQTPKLAWLAENMPEAFARAARFLDLPDFLAYRATGVDVRSLCTTVCKWTYLAHAGGWREDYFRAAGLGALADEGFRRIGADVRPMGERQGALTAKAAAELGLAPGAAVAVAIIDAHAGGLGTIGVAIDGVTPDAAALERRVALIGGTSTCHMAVSRAPRFVPGVWGPYSSAMVPGMWLTEGGQSATGALVEHTLRTHARYAELAADASHRATTPYAILAERLEAMRGNLPSVSMLTDDLHVLPDHHGNRSPRADASLRGAVVGLRLRDTLDELALLYLATIQGIAHGTRHVLDAMRGAGYEPEILVACGGDTKNELFVREHAEATGCRIVLPREPEAVLAGSAILGAVAARGAPSIVAAMGAMTSAGEVVAPSGGEVAAFHDRKHRVFLRMHDDHMAYRAMMRA
ncbi:MAG: FGGY-family carbohydrate kinase [Myxococcales bacterium]|nr:FGGY-family carbohydrate kinase [Myxococcales bacterium]